MLIKMLLLITCMWWVQCFRTKKKKKEAKSVSIKNDTLYKTVRDILKKNVF